MKDHIIDELCRWMIEGHLNNWHEFKRSKQIRKGKK